MMKAVLALALIAAASPPTCFDEETCSAHDGATSLLQLNTKAATASSGDEHHAHVNIEINTGSSANGGTGVSNGDAGMPAFTGACAEEQKKLWRLKKALNEAKAGVEECGRKRSEEEQALNACSQKTQQLTKDLEQCGKDRAKLQADLDQCGKDRSAAE